MARAATRFLLARRFAAGEEKTKTSDEGFA